MQLRSWRGGADLPLSPTPLRTRARPTPRGDRVRLDRPARTAGGRVRAGARRGRRGAHALALSSGSAALHLALVVLGIGRGDEVACASFTFSSSANAIVYTAPSPSSWTADDTWTIDPELLEQRARRASEDPRRRRRRPVRPVLRLRRARGRVRAARHPDRAGRCRVARRRPTAAAPPAGRARSPSSRSTATRSITTSGGGMLVSHDEAGIAHARKLSTQAREPEPHYEHTEIGFNYRLSNLLAAVGRAQLDVLPERLAARRRDERHLPRPARERARDHVHAGGRLRPWQLLADLHRRRPR